MIQPILSFAMGQWAGGGQYVEDLAVTVTSEALTVDQQQYLETDILATALSIIGIDDMQGYMDNPQTIAVSDSQIAALQGYAESLLVTISATATVDDQKPGIWLQSGGANFSYRMSIPVSNPSTQGDRQITTPFPAWFLKDRVKIVQSNYQDVHVTKSDGVTELPCVLNTNKNSIIIDYAAMPQGQTNIYVYYGHASVSAPTTPPSYSFNVLDSGFEYGTDGTNLTSGIWTSVLTPAKREITTANYQDGTRSAHIQSQSGNWGGVKETTSGGMTADGAEYRFWAKFGSATAQTVFQDNSAASADQMFYLQFGASSGVLEIYTDRTATGYTTGGYTTIASGLAGTYEFRIVFNFTTDTWQLSYRTSSTASWTQCKAAGAPDYNIPSRGTNDHTQNYGLIISTYNAAEVWVDYIRYANGGIPAPPSNIVQIIAPNDERTSESDTQSRFYLWGNDIDSTEINSGSPTTFYGNAANHKAGISTAGVKSHYLLKYLEGVLPKGAVSSAKLWVNLESNTNIGEATTLKCHRFLNSGNNTDQTTHVLTGWSVQKTKSYPTWNTRFNNSTSYSPSGPIAWLTAGATNASEVNLSDGNAPTLSLSPGFTIGYSSFDLPASWVADWLTSQYSMGMLIKDSTDTAGSNDRYVPITAPSQINSPVLEVLFSSLDINQLAARKITTDTYTYYATFPTQNRYIQIPSTTSFAVVGWVSADSGVNIAYLAPTGRFHRVVVDLSASFDTNAPCQGLFYDPDEHRFWWGGMSESPRSFTLAYSSAYIAEGWAWADIPSQDIQRGDIMVKNGVVHCLYSTVTGPLVYQIYTRSTGSWSGTTTISNLSVGGTMRGIAVGHAIGAGDMMNGSGEIWLNGSAADYPEWDAVQIDNELFWYTGKDAVNNKLTGVTRAVFGSTAAAHAEAAAVNITRYFYAYPALSYDATLNALQCIYSIVGGNASHQPYIKVCHVRHDFADAATVWRDEAGNTLSLPLDQRTERVLNPSGKVSYGMGAIVLSNGAFLVTVAVNNDLTQTGAGADTWISKLESGAFTKINIAADMREQSFVDCGGGIVFLTGLNTADTTQTQTTKSDDSGSTWSDIVTLSTYSFAGHGGGNFWSSSVSEKSDANGFGYMYATHYAWHGAMFLDGVKLLILENLQATGAFNAQVSELQGYAETPLVSVAATIAVADQENYIENLNIVVGSAVSLADKQAFLDDLLVQAQATAALSDVMGYVEDLSVTIAAIVAVDDQKTGANQEDLLVTVLGIASLTDRQAFLENVTAMAQAGASVAEIQAYIESVQVMAEGSGFVVDSQTGAIVAIRYQFIASGKSTFTSEDRPDFSAAKRPAYAVR